MRLLQLALPEPSWRHLKFPFNAVLQVVLAIKVGGDGKDDDSEVVAAVYLRTRDNPSQPFSGNPIAIFDCSEDSGWGEGEEIYLDTSKVWITLSTLGCCMQNQTVPAGCS